jgi:hypothetical protein
LSLAAPLFLLAFLPTLCWSGSYFKPEFLAVPFSFLAFSSYAASGLSGERPWILKTSTLAAVGILLKLAAAGALIGITGHLIWDRRYKDAARFALCVLGPVTIFYLILSATVGGGVWKMSVAANALKPSWPEMVDYLSNRYLISTLVVLAVACSVPMMLAGRGKRESDAALAAYFIASFTFFVLTAAKPGAGYSYFLEAAIAAALLLPAALDRLRSLDEMNGYTIVVVLLIIGGAMNLKSLNALNRLIPDSVDHVAIAQQLSQLQIPAGAYIMADVHYSLDIVRAGHLPLVNDNLLYSLMVDNGKLPKNALLNCLRAGTVPYLLFYRPVADYGTANEWWERDVTDYVSHHYSCEVIKRPEHPRAAIACVLRTGP